MKRKIIKIAAIVLGVGLVLGLVMPGAVAAQSPNQPQAKTFPPAENIVQGKVLSIAQDGKSFVLEKADKSQVTITVDTSTKYFVRTTLGTALRNRIQEQLRKFEGRFRMKKGEDRESRAGLQQLIRGLKPGSFSDLKVGDSVVVHLVPTSTTARQVLVVEKLPLATVSGTISAIGDKSFTVTKADDTTLALKWDNNTRFVMRGVASLQVGQKVKVLYNSENSLAKLVSVNPPTPTPTPSPTPTGQTA